MLAEKYKTHRHIANQLQSGTNKSQQKNITSTALTLLSNSSDESRNISTAESPDRYLPF